MGGETITVSGSTGGLNDKTFVVVTAAAGVLTLALVEAVIVQVAGPVITINGPHTVSIDDLWYAYLNPIYGPDKTVRDLKYALYKAG